jgi:transcriptional regulator with XRE-family HTH domain
MTVQDVIAIFGANVRGVRNKAGVSLRELGRGAGTDTKQLVLIEAGKNESGATTIAKVALALGVSPGLFFRGIAGIVTASTIVETSDEAAPRNSFGANVRRERKRLDRTQLELGKLAGVKREHLCRIECDRILPGIRIIVRIAQASQASVDALFFGMDRWDSTSGVHRVRTPRRAINRERGPRHVRRKLMFDGTDRNR